LKRRACNSIVRGNKITNFDSCKYLCAYQCVYQFWFHCKYGIQVSNVFTNFDSTVNINVEDIHLYIIFKILDIFILFYADNLFIKFICVLFYSFISFFFLSFFLFSCSYYFISSQFYNWNIWPKNKFIMIIIIIIFVFFGAWVSRACYYYWFE